MKIPPDAWNTTELANATTRPVGPCCGPSSIRCRRTSPRSITSPVTFADLNAIADAQAVFADQEEVTDDRHEHALHGDGDAGGQQAGERREGARFRGERDADDRERDRPDHDSAHEQQLVPSPRLLHVVEYGALPQLAGGEHGAQQHEQQPHASRERLQRRSILRARRGAPAVEIVAVLLEQHAGFGQGHENRGRLRKEPRDRVVFVARGLELGRVARGRPCAELIAASG